MNTNLKMNNLSAYSSSTCDYMPGNGRKKLKMEFLDIVKKYDLTNHEIIIKTTDGGIAWIKVTETIK